MDLRLPLLADANLHLTVAEEAVADGDNTVARNELDKADVALDELREQWLKMSDAERGLLPAMVKPLTHRADGIRSRIPKQSVISKAEIVEDPEQDVEPEEL